MSLKRWAVRQISNLLSDYFEGVTEQNLQASLNLNVGEVEVRGVRVRPGLLTEHQFNLLSSDLSVSARIPWRNLGSEPTVVTISDVWVEARARSPDKELSAAEGDENLRRRRARRAHEIQALVDAQLFERSSTVSSPVQGVPKQSLTARLAHAAVRLLQIRISCLHVRLVSVDGTMPLNICCERFSLDEGAVNGTSNTTLSAVEDFQDAKVDGSLSKVLELVGFAAYLGQTNTSVNESPASISNAPEDDIQWESLRAALAARQMEVERSNNKVLTQSWQEEHSKLKSELRAAALNRKARMAGPLSLTAKVCHLLGEESLLRLHAEMRVDKGASVVWISPTLVHRARLCVDWWLAVSDSRAEPQTHDDLSIEEYTDLILKQLHGETVDADRLEAIEDAAPVWWLCQVQVQCQEKLMSEAQSRRASGLFGWMRRRVSSSTQGIEAGGGDHALEDENIDSVVREAAEVAEAFLPDVHHPRRLEVIASIPPCAIVHCGLDNASRIRGRTAWAPAARTRGQSGILTVEGGVKCRMSMVAAASKSPDIAVIYKAPWDATIKADIMSLNILLDEEALMLLQVDDNENFAEALEEPEDMDASEDVEDITQTGEAQPDDRIIITEAALEAASSKDNPPAIKGNARKALRPQLSVEIFEDTISVDSHNEGSTPGTPLPDAAAAAQGGARSSISESLHDLEPAVSLSVACTHKGGVHLDAAGGEAKSPTAHAARWLLRVRLKQEPFRFILSPWSVRTVLEVATCIKRSADGSGTQKPTDRAHRGGGTSSTPAQWLGLAAADSQQEAGDQHEEAAPLLLDLDLSMAAPVLTWSVPGGQMTIALGRLLLHSCGNSPPPSHLSSPEVCAWNQLSCLCQLVDTGFSVRIGETEEWVYDPSTICVRLWRNPAILASGRGSPEHNGGADWELGVESTVVRWRAGLALLQVAGMVRPSFDYALAPLAGLFVGEDIDAGTSSQPVQPVMSRLESTGSIQRFRSDADCEERGRSLFRIQVSLQRCELEVNVRPAEGRCLRLVCEGIEGMCNMRSACVDATGSIKKAELSHENLVVVMNQEGASLCIVNANHHISAALDSRRFSVHWHGVHIAGMMAAGREAMQHWSQGWEAASQELRLNEGEDAAPRGIEAMLRQKLSQSLMQRRATLIEDHIAEDEDTSMISGSCKATGALPQPRGKCSVDLRVHCEGLTAYFLDGPPSAASVAVPCWVASLTGAECELCIFRSGDSTAQLSLLGVELLVASRRILAPRHAGKLLHITAVRYPSPIGQMFVVANWAQVCLLFRQCDLDFMRSYWQTCISVAINPPRTDNSVTSVEVQNASPSQRQGTESSSEGSSQASMSEKPIQVDFRFDVGAPRVFLPTDRAAVHGSEPHGQGELSWDAVTGEPSFTSKAGDGFLLFDFGHFAAAGESNGAPGPIKLNLRGLHLLGETPEDADGLKDILWPLNLDADVELADSGSFCATSAPDNDSLEPPRHRLSLTRPQLTLILDVLAENLGYLGRAAVRAKPPLLCGMTSQEVTSKAPQQTTVEDSGRGFKFSWRWTGELTLDVAFTDAVPLARFRLSRGLILIESSSVRSTYIVWFAGFSATDTRNDTRNVNRQVLELTSGNDSKPCFEVLVKHPAVGNAETKVEFKNPKFNVLPQLVMDVFGAGLSAWQQCTYRNDPTPQLEELSAQADDERTHSIEVKFTSGVFRVAARWAEPSGHFDFAGSLLVNIVSHARGLTIKSFDLHGGSLLLALAAGEEPTMICTHLEWSVRGEQSRNDAGSVVRQSLLELQQVTLQPYTIRMSMADHKALADALFELFSMDADPAEPPDEVARRDPVSLTMDTRFAIAVSVVVCAAELEILDQVGGQAWPGLILKANCPLFRSHLEFRPNMAPIVNAAADAVELGLWAHNHRLGRWDPVTPSLRLRIMHHSQRQPQRGPKDSVVDNVFEACSPVSVLVSASLVHLSRRIFQSTSKEVRYGYLFAGLNTSGKVCTVATEAGRSVALEPASHLQPLERLLTGGDAADQPQLILTLEGTTRSTPCEISLRRETSILWDTGESGVLVCRLIMPRPPQWVLMLTSTVCILNHSLANIEVRFLVNGQESSLPQEVPLIPETACHTADAGLLDSDSLAQATARTASNTLSTNSSRESMMEGAFLLEAGQFIAAPPAAQRGRGNVILQVRPAAEATGGVSYEWSEPFCSMTQSPASPTCAQSRLHGQGLPGVTLCSLPPAAMRAELPYHWVHLSSSSRETRDQQGNTVDCRDVDIQAPFMLVNACPCDVFCCLGPTLTKKPLGVERTSGGQSVVVLDGCGGEVLVPQTVNGEAEVCPLRLDSGGYIHWINGERRERTKPKWAHTNYVLVKRSPRGGLEWRCFYAAVNHTDTNRVIRIPRQKAVPVYDYAGEDNHAAVQLVDTAGQRSAWSLPVRVGDGAAQRPAEEVLDVTHKNLQISLTARRHGRKLVISARSWFVNSTGEDVILHPPGGLKRMGAVPLFGDGISFLPEAQNSEGDSVATLQLRGSTPTTVRVPDLGGVEELHLSPLHKCCLLTEAVALPGELNKVPCRLVSLVPALMVINKSDYCIGFRQYRPTGAMGGPLWLHPGQSGTFWWVFDIHPKQVQLCARHMTDASSSLTRASSWSPPLEVSKATVGAYPVVLRYGLAERCLVCPTIDESMSVVSVTVHSSMSCHQLRNRHPELVVCTGCVEHGVPREQEELVEFSAYCGHTVPFACLQPFRVRKIKLTLRVAEQSRRSDRPRGEAVLHIDLDRYGTYTLLPRQRRMPAGCLLRSSTLEDVGALITVEIKEKVAVVTVQALLANIAAEQEVGSKTIHVSVGIPQLSVALVSEGARHLTPRRSVSSSRSLRLSNLRRESDVGHKNSTGSQCSEDPSSTTRGYGMIEVFTVNLVDTRLQMERRPDRSSQTEFSVTTLQVDTRYPKKDVVFANTSKPCLKIVLARDDYTMLDVHIRNAHINVGDFEVTMSQAIWEQISTMSHDIAPGAGGLALDEVLARAGMPYHFSCRGARTSSSKLVVWNLTVSQVKANIWWTIYLPQAHYIPETLRVMIAIVSFGVAELDVKGAEVKVPQQQAFSDRNRGEGSFGAVLEQALRLYQPHLKACWKSLLKDSNVLMGGLMSRSWWAPRERRVKSLRDPALGALLGTETWALARNSARPTV